MDDDARRPRGPPWEAGACESRLQERAPEGCIPESCPVCLYLEDEDTESSTSSGSEDITASPPQSVKSKSEPFKSAKDKHRHHDHAIEFNNYLAAYCRRCNMLCRNSYKYLYTLSHNATYDLGVILNELSNLPNREIDIASKDGFKFMKVDIGKLRFMDSLALLNSGLEKLAKEHIKEGKPTTYTSVMLDDVPVAAHHLLKTGKQVFCYDYISSMEKLNEPARSPPEAFFNSLKHEAISETDYTQAKEVFRLAECKTIGDYLKVYLKVDTGLLCDVFTVWRKTMLELYKNLRGGFTSVVQQHTRVENEHTGADPSSTDKYILYLDFNGLYATCMTELLPQGGIRKLSAAECNDWLQQGLGNIACDGDKGYWVMCDTKYVSPEVARDTDDLPLTLSHANISTDILSDYSKHILNTEDRKLPKKNKLIAAHLPQKDYLVSLDLLQMLMKLGLEVAKVNAVYEFQQNKYLKEFVETNARERSNTPCAIKGKAFKLVSNAIYGKSLTNILQIAKRILYDFWYNTVKVHYEDKVRLLYTDTDSYLIELTCPNAFEELNKLPLSQHMDFIKSRDLAQIETLGRQLFGKQDSKKLLDIYKKAISKPYGYLWVDLGVKTPERITFRSNIVAT
ncbi:uncharacterized protein [Procambarus clarkii]|uniref:uncharacterized protein n=1 Tax=Procambarus clarkii TaxID=6728 RepID=UPI00374360F0